MGIGGLFKDFSGWTSSHGIPQIGGASNLCVRLTWVVIFLGSLAMFGYQLYLIVAKYLSYGVSVSTVLNFEERDFPVVTICNLNPYKTSSLHLSTDLQYLVGNYTAAVSDPAGASTSAEWGFQDLRSEIEIRTRAMKNLAFVVNGLTDEVKNNLSYTMDEFVLECAYANEACNRDLDLKEIWDPIYGKCVQFNNEVPPKYTMTRSGVENGLRLMLKADADDFLDMTESGGARVSIHSQNQDPFPDALGFFAGVGVANQFAVKYSKIVRKPAPYGDCTDTGNGNSFYYDTDYTMEGCFRSCFQDETIAACGCADPRFPAPAGQGLCGVSSIDCVGNMFTSQTDTTTVSKNILETCQCPQRCTQQLFGTISSYSKWPSQEYMPKECAIWTASTSTFASQADCNTWYRKNGLLVEIYYERMTYRLLTEDPSYTLYDVVLNFGGQLGLWQGASVITMIEFFAMGIIIGMFCFTSKKAPKDEDINYDEDIDEIYAALGKDVSEDEDEKEDDDETPALPQNDEEPEFDLSELDPAILYAAHRQSLTNPPPPIVDPELSELIEEPSPAQMVVMPPGEDPELDELGI